VNPRAQCDFQMTGVLMHNGEARNRAIDAEGHMVPVLCLELQIETATAPIAHVEQLFPAGHGLQCEAAARRFKKGMRVTFTAPSVGIQLLARNAHHVHLHHEAGHDGPAPAATTTTTDQQLEKTA